MKSIINRNYQKGFSILAVILVIVAVIAVISIWVLSGQTNSNSTGNSTADVQAASIINDGASIKLAFDTLVVNGTSATAVTFVPNTTGSTNMLDPVNGIQIPKANANAIRSTASVPEGIWVYNANALKGNNIGISANTDQAISLSGVKDTICSRINYALYGSTVIPSVTAIANGAAFVTSATSTAPTTAATVDLTVVALTNGWSSGCVSANGVADNNMYFRILKAN